jgi:hypothetical protein
MSAVIERQQIERQQNSAPVKLKFPSLAPLMFWRKPESVTKWEERNDRDTITLLSTLLEVIPVSVYDEVYLEITDDSLIEKLERVGFKSYLPYNLHSSLKEDLQTFPYYAFRSMYLASHNIWLLLVTPEVCKCVCLARDVAEDLTNDFEQGDLAYKVTLFNTLESSRDTLSKFAHPKVRDSLEEYKSKKK